MSTSLASFQSAVQLASGANLAIFALPRLGLEEFEVEDRRWSAAMTAAETLSLDQRLAVRRGRSEFQLKRIEFEGKRRSIRALALIASLEAAGYLIWMSVFPDDPIGAVTIGTLVLGAVPTLNLFANQTEARRLLADSRDKRLAL